MPLASLANKLIPFVFASLFLGPSILFGHSLGNSINKFNTSGTFSFKENKGQFKDRAGNKRPDILFVGSKGNSKVFLRKTGMSYVFSEHPHIVPRKYRFNKILTPSDTPGTVYKGYRLDVEFLNSNSNTKIITENPESSYTDYYLPACPDGLLNVRSYQRIIYQDIYPNIDLVFYTNENGLEYDFNIRKGGNPNDIKLKYNGADKLSLSDEGNLNITFPLGNIIENAPKVYDGNLKQLKSSFSINSEKETVSFHVQGFRNQAITIDPSVQWSTYIGGSGDEYLPTLAVDKDSNVYGVTTTNSPDFPVTTGAFQAALGDPKATNLGIFKFSSSGKLLWSTYYGGSGDDAGGFSIGSSGNNGPGIAVDSLDNIVVVSGTTSKDLPVTIGAYQTSFLGEGDALIAKFNTNGKRVWATYYGDANNGTIGEVVAIDHANNIYITGLVGGPGNLNGSNQKYGYTITSAAPDNEETFVTKFNAGGTRSWSLIYGGNKGMGSGYDFPTDICVDDSNNVIVVGNYYSSNFPLSRNTGYFVGVGMGILYILKFDSSGTRKWAISGGTFATMVNVAADKHNNIYFTGIGMGFLPLKDPYQPLFGGGNTDAFLAKLDNSGNLMWGTYFGGSGTDGGFGVTADSNENVSITGITSSTDFPIKNAIQSTYGGGAYDGFVAKFDESGGLVWSTYLGGNGLDNPTDIERDLRGNLYLGGVNYSGGYPVKNAFQNNSNGGEEGFITKILDCTNLYANVAVTAKNPCVGDTVTLTADGGFSSYKWNNGETTQSIKVTKSGSYSAVIALNAGCNGLTQIITLNFTNPPASSIQADGPLNFCPGGSVSLEATGVYPKYLWSTGDTAYKIVVKNPGKYILTTFNSAGCSVSDSVNVAFSKRPSPIIKGSNNFSLCISGTVVLDAGPGYTKYKWNTGDTVEKISANKIDSFQVTVDSATYACSGTSPWVHTYNIKINIQSSFSPYLCGDSIILDAGAGFDSYLWNTGETTERITVKKTGKYQVTVHIANGCSDSSKPFVVTIFPAPAKPLITSDGDTLLTGTGKGFHYQWFKNGNPLIGEIKNKLYPVQAGTYAVEITDSNGCLISSDSFVIANPYFKVYPNPTTAFLNVEAETNEPADYKYELFDMLGRVLIKYDDGVHAGAYKKTISLEPYAAAMYILVVKVGSTVYTNKIMKGQRY